MSDITFGKESHFVRIKDFRIVADYNAWDSEFKHPYYSVLIEKLFWYFPMGMSGTPFSLYNF